MSWLPLRALFAFAVLPGGRGVGPRDHVDRRSSGGAQTRDMFPTLTVPAARLPEGCRLTVAGGPAVRTLFDLQITLESGVGFPTNPSIGRDPKPVALIRQSIDGRPVYPDGPPLTAREMAVLEANWSNNVVDAYRASYSMGDAITVVMAIRFDDERLTRPEAPIGKRTRARGERTQTVLGSTVAVVHSPGRNPCYDAVAAYVRALK